MKIQIQIKRRTIFLALYFIIIVLCIFFIIKYKDNIIGSLSNIKQKNINSTTVIVEERNNEITQHEIEMISNSIMALACPNSGQTAEAFGSGTLIDPSLLIADSTKYAQSNTIKKLYDAYSGKNDYYFVLTNAHVATISGLSADNFLTIHGHEGYICEAVFNEFPNDSKWPDDPEGELYYFAFQEEDRRFIENIYSDLAIISIPNPLYVDDLFGQLGEEQKELLEERSLKDIKVLKESKKEKGDCIVSNPVGLKVFIFGYPAYATESYKNITNTSLPKRSLIISEGIISGKTMNDQYYTDTKVDAGNSGGLAITKIEGNLCIVGIPTWVSEGIYENLGIIQPLKFVYSDFEKYSYLENTGDR